MSDLPKPFTEMSDTELLTHLTRGNLPADEKAKIVLAVRERKVAEKQNRSIIKLTIVMAIATAVQAIGVIDGLVRSPEISKTCQCISAPSEDKAQRGQPVINESNQHTDQQTKAGEN